MNDEDLERVLKGAGQREKPPPEVERAVRQRLRDEWRAVVADRHRRSRRRAISAIAAGLVVAAIGVWAVGPRLTASNKIVATVALVTGELRVNSGWFGFRQRIGEGQPLMLGQTLETGPAGRVALALPTGVSVRLDHRTRLSIPGADRLKLERGTLYVDSGVAVPADRLDVLTPSGSVRHIGTQYEVHLLEPGVRLRVRDGRIEWRSRTGELERGAAGEQLTILDSGSVERRPVPGYGTSWDWAAGIAPAIEIEGLPLAAFLSWAARELGRDVDYASPQIEGEVADIVVHGSIAGLTPAQALDAVLATTSVRATIADRRIVVERH
ncbi:MAG: FecR domain-containing protein [Steroidobacteraceae bacterium]